MGRQFVMRGAHPNPEWRPGDRHEAKGARCKVVGGAWGRISHAYNDAAKGGGPRYYVVLDNGQSGWFTQRQIVQLDEVDQ